MARARGRQWRLQDLDPAKRYSLVWDAAERRWDLVPWGADEPLVTKPAATARGAAGAAEATQSRAPADTAGRHRLGP
jgi:hypothetical protein